jgi:hypothetical protein
MWQNARAMESAATKRELLVIQRESVNLGRKPKLSLSSRGRQRASDTVRQPFERKGLGNVIDNTRSAGAVLGL